MDAAGEPFAFPARGLDLDGPLQAFLRLFGEPGHVADDGPGEDEQHGSVDGDGQVELVQTA